MSYAKKEDAEEKTEIPTPPEDPKGDLRDILKQVINAIQGKEAQVAHHLDRIATALETLSKQPTTNVTVVPARSSAPPATPISTPPPTPLDKPTPAPSYLDQIREAFSTDLKDLLKFEQKDDKTIIIKTRRFLGSDNFAKIASVVRALGGEYISAGKDSHFKVQKE